MKAVKSISSRIVPVHPASHVFFRPTATPVPQGMRILTIGVLLISSAVEFIMNCRKGYSKILSIFLKNHRQKVLNPVFKNIFQIFSEKATFSLRNCYLINPKTLKIWQIYQ